MTPTATNMHRLIILLTLIAGTAYAVAGQNAEAKVAAAQKFVMPDGAEAAGVGGIVVVAASVDETGTVKRATVVAGPSWPCGAKPGKHIDRVLDAVRANVLATKFVPETKNGVAYDAELLLTFALGEDYRNAVKEPEFAAALKAGKSPSMMDVGSIFGRNPAVRALSLPKPAYPAKARAARASGAVPVRVVINEAGTVAWAGAIGGHPLLQNAARESGCAAKFEPTTVDGRPVRVTGIVLYNFVPR